MTSRTGRSASGRQRTVPALTVGVILAAACLSGCGVINDVKTVAHNVEGNKNTVDAFTTKMTASEATPFQATYVTTGSSPATIVYAVRPPKDLLFKATSTGGSTGAGGVDLIVNSTGEYSCTPPSSSGSGSSTWTCQKLGTAQTSVQNQLLDLYTPAHWVAFLKGLSLAAGFAGDKVTQSTMTANGFNMDCVDLQASGVPGTSTICTTSQGILGYVKVASETTSFQLVSYSGSPSDSLFRLPAGAKITTS
jgi:hypothetical protein